MFTTVFYYIFKIGIFSGIKIKRIKCIGTVFLLDSKISKKLLNID